MTTFIKLHTSDGEPIYINPAYIVSVFPIREGSRVVTVRRYGEYDITETPSEVLDRIWREEIMAGK